MKPDYSLYTFVTSVAILVLQLQTMIDPRLKDSLSTRFGVSGENPDTVGVPTIVHASEVFEGEWGPEYVDGHIPHPSYVHVAGPGEDQGYVDSVAGLAKLRTAANTHRAILTAANRMPPETPVSRMIAEQTRKYMAEDTKGVPDKSSPGLQFAQGPMSPTAPGLGVARRPQQPAEPFRSKSELLTYVSGRFVNKFGVVLGVGPGAFTKQLLSLWQRSYLYLVDPYIHLWRGYEDAANVDDKTHQLIFERLRSEIHELRGRFTFVRDFSAEFAKTYAAAATQPKAAFLWVDANHSYKSVTKDLASWFPLVESGGIIAGSSYANRAAIEVKRAVDEFAAANHIKLHIVQDDITGADPVWVMIKP